MEAFAEHLQQGGLSCDGSFQLLPSLLENCAQCRRFVRSIHHVRDILETAAKPPQLDEFFSVGEAPLRAGDFAELGWTENDIWPAQA